MPTLNRRLQILVDQDRYARLERRARERGTSVATLVREALDLAYPATDQQRWSAIDRLLEAAPIDLGDWEQLSAEIESGLDRG